MSVLAITAFTGRRAFPLMSCFFIPRALADRSSAIELQIIPIHSCQLALLQPHRLHLLLKEVAHPFHPFQLHASRQPLPAHSSCLLVLSSKFSLVTIGVLGLGSSQLFCNSTTSTTSSHTNPFHLGWIVMIRMSFRRR